MRYNLIDLSHAYVTKGKQDDAETILFHISPHVNHLKAIVWTAGTIGTIFFLLLSGRVWRLNDRLREWKDLGGYTMHAPEAIQSSVHKGSK